MHEFPIWTRCVEEYYTRQEHARCWHGKGFRCRRVFAEAVTMFICRCDILSRNVMPCICARDLHWGLGVYIEGSCILVSILPHVFA